MCIRNFRLRKKRKEEGGSRQTCASELIKHLIGVVHRSYHSNAECKKRKIGIGTSKSHCLVKVFPMFPAGISAASSLHCSLSTVGGLWLIHLFLQPETVTAITASMWPLLLLARHPFHWQRSYHWSSSPTSY